MTTAELAALAEAKAILRLHFDAFIVTTRTSDENGYDQVNTDWHGSLSDIIGIHRMTAVRLDKLALDRSALPEIK